jgi:hypothetical protein
LLIELLPIESTARKKSRRIAAKIATDMIL